MRYIDVFNGDADGLCALHQLRLADPLESSLVSGTKRDVGLLAKVDAQAGDEITVLDVSLQSNRAALKRLLAQGARVRYFDHHYAGRIPQHAALTTFIDTAADVCTSIIVDRHLRGRHCVWAIVAAFGDHLVETAFGLCRDLSLAAAQITELRELGECLNYNSYGENEADLYFPPVTLYELLRPYADPFAFIAEESAFAALRVGYAEDLELAWTAQPELESDAAALYLLPDAAWARRVSGVFGNTLAESHPNRAHAVLTHNSRGGYTVSVRAPLARRTGADRLCRNFATGGGRKAAAGITHLPRASLAEFVRGFEDAYAKH